jgi:serine/threonine protein kinase
VLDVKCLSGRPPLLEADDAATRHRIVSFHVQDSSREVDGLFQGKHAAGISAEARDLIENLLERDASCRPAMAQVAQHNFFWAGDASSAGATPMDVFSLHKQPAYPLDVGDVSPTPDSDQWSRYVCRPLFA